MEENMKKKKKKKIESKFFSGLALKTFVRVGDILIPAEEDFPSFSQQAGVEHLDRVAAYMPPDDMRQLNALMTCLAFTPSFFLRWLASQAAASHQSTRPWAPLFRKLYYGWWGFIFGAYYSGRPGGQYHGPNPAELIGFHLNRVID
jgi:hypothetical protein